MKTIWHLLTSKFLWKNVGIAIGVAVLAVFATFFLLRYVTHHDERVEVPDLVGLNEEEARVFLQQKGIVLEVIDSVQVRGYRAGEIVEQNPAPHTFVKKGRHIYLTVNSRRPRTIPVPDMTDVSYRQAKAMLEALGFVVANIVYVPSEFSGLVQQVQYEERTVAADERLPDGASVVLVVGELSSEAAMAQVPSLTTLPYNEAQRVLEQAGFVLGAVVNDETILTDEDKNAAFVWRQEPQADEVVASGKRIDLWLTTDPEKLNQQVEETAEEEIFF